MVESVGNTRVGGRRSLFKALKPLLYWLLASVVLLGVYYYRKYSRETTSVVFRLAVEGRRPTLGYAVTLDGVQYNSGQATTLGKKTLVLKGREFGTVKRHVFVWFGTNDLGLINVPRLRGGLEVMVDPKPREIRVNSTLWGEVTSKSGTSFTGLPVGDYHVTLVFDHFQEQRDVQLVGNKTTRLEVKPSAGFVSIAADPADANFRLTGASGSYLDLQGDTPKTFLLPAGDYQLRVWRGRYVKNMSVRVATGNSNRIVTRFEYGTVHFVTTPAGATVSEGFRNMGQTPNTLSDLIPGSYRFRLALADYLPVDVDLTVAGDSSITVNTNLVNVHFARAMERARWELRQHRPNYHQALASIEVALKATPGNSEALELKTQVEAALKEEQAQIAKQKQQLSERRQTTAAKSVVTVPTNAPPGATAENQKEAFASAEFAKVTHSLKDAALFDTHVWTFDGDVAKVRQAVLRTLRHPRYDWRLQGDSKINDETYILRASDTALSLRRNYCVLLVSQVAEGKVVVYAKFWQYRRKSVPLITFGSQAPSGPTYVPVHPDYYDPKLAAIERKAMADSIKSEISKQLK